METTTLHRTEQRRLEEQTRLDRLKSAPQRNKLGQFATPPELALSIARHLRKFIDAASPLRFLDPAIGTGSFFSAVSQVFSVKQISAATGVEIDPLFAQAAAQLWNDRGIDIVHGDFTQLPTPKNRFNLIVTNPPYVRHHHLSGVEKDRLKMRLARSLHLDISGLAGLYCYFLLLCHDWMEEDGLAVWLIPSEFMDVNYGNILRQYLSERVTLLQIHRFCPHDMQFADALVSSAVVIFRKTSPRREHTVHFSFAGPIEHPQRETQIPLDVLRGSRKWTQFPESDTASPASGLTLGDFFSIKRGLATGANDFFILNEDQITQWKIPRSCLKPILPGPRYITENIIKALPNGAPDVLPHLYLIDSNLPDERIKTRWPTFYEYLEHGRAREIHSQYITSHRIPWYSQEQRPPAPFLCTYMGRARNGKSPFRFIWNQSQATAHNVYLLLYPKGQLQTVLTQHPALEGRVFEALQSITPMQLVSEGRIYGGGLHKMEPKELAQISARSVLDAVGEHASIEYQMALFQ